VFWLKDLDAVAVSVGNLRLESAAVSRALEARCQAVTYRARETPVHLALVLDNGEGGAAADRALARVAASRSLVDAVLCRGGESSCPYGAADVSLLVLQRGAVDVKEVASRDQALLARRLDELAEGGGGETPLWDGVQEALLRVRSAITRDGGTGAVVVYAATTSDTSSRVSAAEVKHELEKVPAVPLLAALGAGERDPLFSLAEASGGALLQLGGDMSLEEAFAAARCSVVGRWDVGLAVSPGATVPPGVYQLQGELRLSLGPEWRTALLGLPFRVPEDR
jgi:hypothetical protein